MRGQLSIRRVYPRGSFMFKVQGFEPRVGSNVSDLEVAAFTQKCSDSLLLFGKALLWWLGHQWESALPDTRQEPL